MWLRDVRKPEMHLIRLGVRTHLYWPGLESKFKYSALYGSNASEECLAQRTHIFCIACRALRNDNQFFFCFMYLCTGQIEASTSPPGNPPGQPPGNPRAFEFLEKFSPGRKAVQMPPHLGKLPDYCFNFSVVSIVLLRLCM